MEKKTDRAIPPREKNLAPAAYPGLENLTTMTARAVFYGQRFDFKQAANERGSLSGSSPVIRIGKEGVAILFRYGVVVFFNVPEPDQRVFFEQWKPFTRNPLDKPETESLDLLSENGRPEHLLPDGKLVLSRFSFDRLQILASILGKSTVLAYYEQQVARVFDRIEKLSDDLKNGAPLTPGPELLQEIGRVLSIELETTGRVEVAEKPEITWDNPELDRFYGRLATEYELADRDSALSRKLQLISDTVETYMDLVHSQQSLRVEWYIVFLIVVEIILTLIDKFWK